MHVFDELVAEVVRRTAAERGVSLAVRAQRACPKSGCLAVKATPRQRRQGADRPQVRVRTRTALNRRTGTSMDAKLFSHEALESRVLDGTDSGKVPAPLRLTADLQGLDEATSRLVSKLQGREVWLGGKRGQGMGGCRLQLMPAEPMPVTDALAAVEGLQAALNEGWEALRAAAAGRPGSLFAAGERPLALVLTEPWCPGEQDGELSAAIRQGPLAGAPGVLSSFVRLGEEGRFGAIEGRHYGAPVSGQGERPPVRVVAPGSTYVYVLPEGVLEDHLEKWLELGRGGQGLHREVGWGRFLIRGADPDF